MLYIKLNLLFAKYHHPWQNNVLIRNGHLKMPLWLTPGQAFQCIHFKSKSAFLVAKLLYKFPDAQEWKRTFLFLDRFKPLWQGSASTIASATKLAFSSAAYRVTSESAFKHAALTKLHSQLQKMVQRFDKTGRLGGEKSRCQHKPYRAASANLNSAAACMSADPC